MKQHILAQKQICFLSNEINSSLGVAKVLFHRDTLIKLTFKELGSAQEAIPHLGNRIKLLTLTDWEAKDTKTTFSLDTIQKALAFKGIKPIPVEVYPDGTYSLI